MWVKKGLIYPEQGQLPTVEVGNDFLRIYFSVRENGISAVNFIEVDKDDPAKILYVNKSPVLTSGEKGCFDDSGVMPSCILVNCGFKMLYYTGWNKRGTVPYGHAVGVAMCYEDRPTKFERFNKGPLLDRSVDEPFLCNSAFVLDEFTYYCSGTGWQDDFPMYNIACRTNGRRFTCIENGNRLAISRPCVVRDGGRYKMWYSYKGKDTPYEMGYAESHDPINWDVVVGPIIYPSDDGWDSEMICYPWVVCDNGLKYMFYNGNGYGKSGIGYAVWK